MLTHAQIWRGIDRLAAHAQTSPSGLARRAGLDATTFNPSKRQSTDGKKERWPSSESIAKALAAAHVDFGFFADLVAGTSSGASLPSLALWDTDTASAFDACGLPAGDGWSKVRFPDMSLEHCYALTVTGHDMAPVYRDGDQLVVSPESPPLPGDRIVVKTRDGVIGAWELSDSDVQNITLIPLSGGLSTQTRSLADIVWIAKIVWASQ
jgi:phage repressor protein C with HTH and peptisase S24 domain